MTAKNLMSVKAGVVRSLVSFAPANQRQLTMPKPYSSCVSREVFGSRARSRDTARSASADRSLCPGTKRDKKTGAESAEESHYLAERRIPPAKSTSNPGDHDTFSGLKKRTASGGRVRGIDQGLN